MRVCRCSTWWGRRARHSRIKGLRHSDVPYAVLPFVDRMDLAYAAADLVLSRCGANSVVEAAAVGLPAIFVPLPIGNGEQEHNARPVVEAGGALLVKDADLTSAWVASQVPMLANDPGEAGRDGGRGVRPGAA